MIRSAFLDTDRIFGVRSAFSPYKPPNINCPQVLQPIFLPHSLDSHLYRCQYWPALKNEILFPVMQKSNGFVNLDYQSAEYYEDRLMKNENARRRRKAEKKREEALRDRIHILEYENDQMRQEIEYLRLKLQTKGAQGEKSM